MSHRDIASVIAATTDRTCRLDLDPRRRGRWVTRVRRALRLNEQNVHLTIRHIDDYERLATQ